MKTKEAKQNMKKTPRVRDYKRKTPSKTEEIDCWAEQEKPEFRNVFVWNIKRVHPKIVVVSTGPRNAPVELTLALTKTGYEHMIKLASNLKLTDLLPLIFAVDPKGYVLGWITYRKWIEPSEPQQPQPQPHEKTENEKI